MEEEPSTSPQQKKLKSPIIDPHNLNTRNSVTCENVPEELFDAETAKKHFSKFGRVQRIRLFPKRQMCMIEYDQPASAERAVLNAGAFDGFMFDVTRSKQKIRRRSKKDDDPEWIPDPELQDELSAMMGAPMYRAPRQTSMQLDHGSPSKKPVTQKVEQVVMRKKVAVPQTHPKRTISQAKPTRPTVSDLPAVPVVTQTTLGTAEAAAELAALAARAAISPDERWRTLDARDRILRAWGGAGSRVRSGGATIGTCRDMCPEKERLHRQAEHQVMNLETVPGSDGEMDVRRAVKQYSRSSADQEIPMCYELRSVDALRRTCAYLLHEIADTERQVSLADWFHFMWDRFRGIRKDIAQQALCCAESIRLVEMCARFHAHCAARLADLEHTQFDQKLNTDNLTKCLQTLKHMYADVDVAARPREPEFRGYVALLNLGDSNFWWEIKQLPHHIQKSAPITFAIKVFNAIDNNNYVRFFRLVREEATYLQSCILLRYFNDVRARALARTVKAFAPRGGSKYPAEELMNALAFESLDSMRSFVTHYGLRFGVVEDSEVSVILDRNHFYEDSDPYPISRAVNLIETKRNCSVGQVIAGGPLPAQDYRNHELYSSFNANGKMRIEALLAEDQGYNTRNDTMKDVTSLKAELLKLLQGGSSTKTLFVKLEPRNLSPKPPPPKLLTVPAVDTKLKFSFTPAIPVAPSDIIKTSPEKITETKNIFSFSKPQETAGSNLWSAKDTGNIPKPAFESKPGPGPSNVFKAKDENNPFHSAQSTSGTNQFKQNATNSVFGQPSTATTRDPKSIFGSISQPANVFSKPQTDNVFGNKLNAKIEAKDNILGKKESNVFAKQDPVPFGKPRGNLFATGDFHAQDAKNDPKSVFGNFKPNVFSGISNVFGQSNGDAGKEKPFGVVNGSLEVSPRNLFRSEAENANSTGYSVFQTKNAIAIRGASNSVNSIDGPKSDVYEFNEEDNAAQLDQERIEQLQEEEIKRVEEEERRRREELRKHEEHIQEMKRREEEKRLELLRKQEERRRLEEERKKEEARKKEELKRKEEEEKRQAEINRKAEEAKQRFREQVDKESAELIEELLVETNHETVVQLVKEEIDNFNQLMEYADEFTEELINDLCKDMLETEMSAEKYWTEKLLKKWFVVWRRQLLRNRKRRSLLHDTPVWLADRTPEEKASYLRRFAEKAALKNMNAIHRGYRFSGELKQPPTPDPFNVMEIIKSSLLKRMKQIHYPYDKCFFWKVTLLSPGAMKYVCRKIDIEKWLVDAFGDKKTHETSDTLVQVGKHSWNNLMDFAISVSLSNSQETKHQVGEAIEGSNGLLFYSTENDDLIQRISDTLKQRYPYQVLPLAIVMPRCYNELMETSLEAALANLVNSKAISDYKIFTLDPKKISESLIKCTKYALKWLAKNCPTSPPLEIDYLKSVCQRYLGHEIWYKLKSERESRLKGILKDLYELVSLYNAAVDRLTTVITNEDLFNYPSFPLEFKQYLDENSPYPKPYEFIPCNAKNSENILSIKAIMKQLKLPKPQKDMHPLSVASLQEEMRTYCNQIGWFEKPEEVVCKVIAVLPEKICHHSIPQEEFSRYLEHYDLLDLLNIIVYEKINNLSNFHNRYAVYERSALEEYRSGCWWYETDAVKSVKHKPIDYEDDYVDYMLMGAKRRKLEESFEYLMLEDKDITIVEENIRETDEKIVKYNSCNETVQQLEQQLEQERIRSLELENLLKAALADVY